MNVVIRYTSSSHGGSRNGYSMNAFFNLLERLVNGNSKDFIFSTISIKPLLFPLMQAFVLMLVFGNQLLVVMINYNPFALLTISFSHEYRGQRPFIAMNADHRSPYAFYMHRSAAAGPVVLPELCALEGINYSIDTKEDYLKC
ncbi:hypothetical protein [Echinicola pacifica]|nr:hypothetical protein [Echinicola pacifica]